MFRALGPSSDKQIAQTRKSSRRRTYDALKKREFYNYCILSFGFRNRNKVKSIDIITAELEITILEKHQLVRAKQYYK